MQNNNQISPAPSDSYAQSFARGLSVILAFGPSTPLMTLTEVAGVTGLTRAGARRILLTLEYLGYVSQENRKFSLTPKILDLGYSYLSANPLWELATPYMEEVVQQTGETCTISVLEGNDIVYIMRVATHRIMSVNLSIGSRLPAWATSMGRILLGGVTEKQLDSILSTSNIIGFTPRTVTDIESLKNIIALSRQRGFCFVNEELEEGLQSIAVPIFGRDGRIIAAMNVGGHANRVNRAGLLEIVLPHLQNAAFKISQLLKV
ncbi:IclR family transcriptional regulator C-terminal domain-containing protein [Pseudomonas hefeiensis]|uniref:IclR family transcriptional regulator C-terminal domain-containing protein n=1 Tax=Pseudomonas hefeiensis TaxID=2738125 RepID=A0ABY9GGQ3_9PSED|nr:MULTISPECIES: IclR family transcriptional regulator C-terminal domain-containing protein [unclassified Pseudomonas]WLH14847.1 IclR family transcriptional regulator C-terminal domain-containing protein [Pseudomonas sp. FP205]WLH97900.1 IclR family transcriptional regulator C-terminal domain-containing protein [Pseudomonas sp. FP53]WLI42173.1 IclR family transcriptional regulator C-terminal domain-containing protein [Pseudomonas sp. FP821]